MPKIVIGTNTAKTNRMILKPIFHLQRSVATLNFCNNLIYRLFLKLHLTPALTRDTPPIKSRNSQAVIRMSLPKCAIHRRSTDISLGFDNIITPCLLFVNTFLKSFFEKSKKRKRTVKPPVPFAVTYSECVQMLLCIA